MKKLVGRAKRGISAKPRTIRPPPHRSWEPEPLTGIGLSTPHGALERPAQTKPTIVFPAQLQKRSPTGHGRPDRLDASVMAIIFYWTQGDKFQAASNSTPLATYTHRPKFAGEVGMGPGRSGRNGLWGPSLIAVSGSRTAGALRSWTGITRPKPGDGCTRLTLVTAADEAIGCWPRTWETLRLGRGERLDTPSQAGWIEGTWKYDKHPCVRAMHQRQNLAPMQRERVDPRTKPCVPSKSLMASSKNVAQGQSVVADADFHDSSNLPARVQATITRIKPPDGRMACAPALGEVAATVVVGIGSNLLISRIATEVKPRDSGVRAAADHHHATQDRNRKHDYPMDVPAAQARDNLQRSGMSNPRDSQKQKQRPAPAITQRQAARSRSRYHPIRECPEHNSSVSVAGGTCWNTAAPLPAQGQNTPPKSEPERQSQVTGTAAPDRQAGGRLLCHPPISKRRQAPTQGGRRGRRAAGRVCPGSEGSLR